MTITAPEPGPDARERASDSAAVVDAAVSVDGLDRSVPGCGGPRLAAVPEREDARAVGELGAAASGDGPAPAGSGGARRLRAAPLVQLELVSDREGPGPELVWASLPERSREAVLVLLARLIDAGVVAEEGR